MARINSKNSDIAKKIMELANSRYTWQAWSDVISMCAIAISNSMDIVHFDKRERQYMNIVTNYNGNERQTVAEIMAMVTDGFEQNPEQDLLGDLYMELNLGNHWTGQFFTPYGVCRAMAEIQDYRKNETDNFITVNDCACGGGATLIAAANSMKKRGINYQQEALFTAQDIDFTTAMMCYIQLSLLGCCAVVKVGDSIGEPMVKDEFERELYNSDSNYWYSPMFIVNSYKFCR